MIKSLQDLKKVNKIYFSKDNKKFFNDINYKLLTGGKSKSKFFIQHTYRFSDMFDGIKKAVFLIKPVSVQGNIKENIKTVDTIEEVKTFLKTQ